MIFNVTGGGGTSLNFKVLAYPDEAALLAATPAENTIGIITTTPITGYHFGTEEPSPATPGMVWITVGRSSQVAFNALKKNSIMVYPISAKQHIGGALVDVTAKSYSGGAWKAWWAGELYVDGVLYCEPVDDIRNGTIEQTDAGIVLTPKASVKAFLYKRWEIDMTGIKAIHATMHNAYASGSGPQNIIVTKTDSNVEYANETIKAQRTAAGEDTISLEIPQGSLKGKYYVYIGTESPSYSSLRIITLKKAWCEFE